MDPGLTLNDVSAFLERLKESVTREECWSCDCFQGFITQLELDADDDVKTLTGPLKVTHQQMHECLGCDPCPPAALFAEYLRSRNQS